ncbi:MAG: leucyl/phenylalanyl-tRNA--protein transferase [Nitrospirae bacterium]|nr:leucyl/phenylalanyl-tRNA--protein transferase [Nitrospirota bacterium]MBI3594904.1 leucyl/phenylalanyl-tRNA--protein transferase [Nitrospirota bacterium]
MGIPNALTPLLLETAYRNGIFPMGHPDGSFDWYSPDPRGIIDLNHFHFPSRLSRTLRQEKFSIQINHDFDRVIRECAARKETWITEEIISSYMALHRLGKAHSVEAYLRNHLAGGLYGVALGGAFMGESMFTLERDASKVCLVYLVQRLNERGFQLLDTQFITPHLRQFGAIEIKRQEYMKRLQRALALPCQFVP